MPVPSRCTFVKRIRLVDDDPDDLAPGRARRFSWGGRCAPVGTRAARTAS